MSWVILATCLVPGQTRFMGWICAASLRADRPRHPLPPQAGCIAAAAGDQGRSRDATPSFHILLTPILMKCCGFWLRLAKSIFAPW